MAPLNGLVREALRAGGEDVVAMKDPTRGGVAGVLHEMAAKAKVGVVLDEAALPVRDEVRAAAEMVGIDPLLVATEGKAVIGVRPGAAERVLAALRCPDCQEPARLDDGGDALTLDGIEMEVP